MFEYSLLSIKHQVKASIILGSPQFSHFSIHVLELKTDYLLLSGTKFQLFNLQNLTFPTSITTMKNQHPAPQNEVILLCLNPKCSQPKQRCLDSRTIRTHPSDCSRHYFSVDTILNTHWSNIQDYPSDPLGLSVSKKIGQKTENQKNGSFYNKIIESFKIKIEKVINQFSRKFEQFVPSSCLQDYYYSTFSLQQIAKNLGSGYNSEFIANCINKNFSKGNYGQLFLVNEKIEAVQQALQKIVSGVKNQMKSLLDSMISNSKSNQVLNYPFKFEDGKTKPKIQFGLIKSKFVASSKIQCRDGQITFPKLENVVSFLPWVYTDRGFTTGIHEMRITSLKFASVPNSGFTVLQQHDLDTYPYHHFKSLFSKQSKGFKLVDSLTQYDPFQSATTLKKNSENGKRHSSPFTEIEHTISQVAQMTLRIELNATPRAIIRNAQGNSIYICPLQQGKKYRMGLYGAGWTVTISELF